MTAPLRSILGMRLPHTIGLLLLALAGAVTGLGVVAAPPALNLPDPTRPPAAVAAAAAVPGPSASGRVTGTAPSTPSTEAGRSAALPRLQSVQLRGGADSALIDDRMVRVGDKVGERIVVAIDAEGVLLRGSGAGSSGGERRLRLLGGDEKQPPGSIQVTRSARWQADPLPTPMPNDPALAGAPAPTRPAPVSLAERTRP